MSVMSTSSPCQTGCGRGDLHGLGENRPRIQIVHSWMSCGSRCLFRSRLHGLKSSSQVMLHEWFADNLGEMLVGRLDLPSPPGQVDPGISWAIFARAALILGSLGLLCPCRRSLGSLCESFTSHWAQPCSSPRWSEIRANPQDCRAGDALWRRLRAQLFCLRASRARVWIASDTNLCAT